MSIQVFSNYQEIKGVTDLVLTIGTFDGLHLGHVAVLENLTEKAKSIHGQTGVLSFYPHPRKVLNPQSDNLKLLQSLPEKTHRLDELNIQNLILLPFTVEFSHLSSTEFIEKILVNYLNIKHIAIGYDHHFGRSRSGGLDELIALGKIHHFGVSEIPVYQINQVNISSTKIREALAAGSVTTAYQYLGYRYSISGKVVRGNQIGRKIGFPTANILPEDPDKLIPALGVYAIWVIWNQKRYPAVLNIGTRPTFNGQNVQIEAHLINFEQDLYDQSLTIEFIDFIRPQQRFETVDKLIAQIQEDIIVSQHKLSDFQNS
ncbi:MAG: bifunctional riboflavin kinase/FAD synthetase [Bacteroidia bacterium]|nr:bifunctional riboflavin kinase/FAD synthetase [Bacteroidia bacterium]